MTFTRSMTAPPPSRRLPRRCAGWVTTSKKWATAGSCWSDSWPDRRSSSSTSRKARESAGHATGRFVYSLEVKRDFRRLVRYECPPRFSPAVVAAVEKAALTAFRALGCRDFARIDFRLRDGIPHFLEVNPLPGLNPETSDLVILAELAGWTHAQLIEAIFQAALDRQS